MLQSVSVSVCAIRCATVDMNVICLWLSLCMYASVCCLSSGWMAMQKHALTLGQQALGYQSLQHLQKNAVHFQSTGCLVPATNASGQNVDKVTHTFTCIAYTISYIIIMHIRAY